MSCIIEVYVFSSAFSAVFLSDSNTLKMSIIFKGLRISSQKSEKLLQLVPSSFISELDAN